MIPFEEIQEQCVQNKEKVDKWSKFLTLGLIAIIGAVSYYLWDYTLTKIILAIFTISGIISTVTSNTTEDRIYSKFSSAVGLGLIVILSVIISMKTSFFIEESTFMSILKLGFFAFATWWATYLIHCVSVNLLDVVFFQNPTLLYTTRIKNLEHKRISSKHGTNHYYYAYFYDYTGNEQQYEITEAAFNNYKVGDAIKTILQPRIDGVEVNSMTRLKNFQGLTDMEIDQQNHKRDVELFGQSQEEMDAAKGEVKSLSYKWVFMIICVFDAILYFYIHNNFSPVLNAINVYPFLIISFAVTMIVSYLEYKKINDKYTLEDLGLWKDYLVPRCLIYILSTFVFSEYIFVVIKTL